MNEAPQYRVREIFLEAVEIEEPAARGAFLDQVCRGDCALRLRVEELLAADQVAGGSRGLPAAELLPKVEVIGNRVGRYKLLQQIGEGGCGIVYMAEQEEPVRRKVALKVIKLGMDTRQVVARFEAERQALALMDHPNIAKVLDAGATDSGRPYFVMELVRGVKITDYCDHQGLGTRQRLDLFIEVCHAVQHAHQKGIIHRDLKPSNILVTELDGAPLPKIIDFGIAKAVEGRLTDQTLFTAFEQFLGTPAYMSPEQAAMSAADIDTRSDIYSLGVLLYELLTGKTPFDTKALLASGLDEMRRTICEVKPVLPSTRLRQSDVTSSPASSRLTRPSPLATDLDWIVMKCLEKDRKRRYETANGVAMDLQRHLANEPILARPPSRVYEFQKSVRRHKVGFAAAAAVVLALVAGVLVSSWQATRATRAETQAVAARTDEANSRKLAQVQELAARRRAYASDMMLAKEVLGRDNFRTALDLLDQQRPEPGQPDLRGWEWRYLWQQLRSAALFSLGPASGQISALAVSPAARWLAVGLNHRGGLSVWDLPKRQESIRLAENAERIRAAFSPVEPLLAFANLNLLDSGQQRSTLHLWNAGTGQMVDEAPLDAECAGLAFSRDGRRLVTSTEEGHITLWRVREGAELEPVARYPCQQCIFEASTCFAATPDLTLAAYTYAPPGEHMRQVRLVDLRNGKELWHARAAKFIVTALEFSPDGKTLATARGIGEKPNAIDLWDVESGKAIGRALTGHRELVFSLVFLPDGTRLISAGLKTIRIWDLAQYECLDVLPAHDQLRRLALFPDGHTLVSGGAAGRISFWDTSVNHPRQPHVTIPAKVLAWCFAPDSHRVLTLDASGQVAQWTGTNFQRKEPLLEIAANPDRRLYRFSQDGRFLALGSTNGVLQVWNLSQRQLQRQWTNTKGGVVPLEFRSDGGTLYSWSRNDNRLHKWNFATGREILSLPVAPWPRVGGFSPDGRLGIETDEAGNIWRWNLTDGSKLSLPPPLLECSDVAFSPDGRLLAISSVTAVTRVWNTATWSAEATNLYGLHSVAFSPDSRRLATGAGDGLAVNLWDVGSWKKVLNLQAENDGFSGTAFSSDGNAIGSLNMAGTLYLWNAPSWEAITAAEKEENGENGDAESAQPMQESPKGFDASAQGNALRTQPANQHQP